jgi:hypothetical protein
MAATDIVMTRGAIDGSQRLPVREVFGVKALMAVDAIQGGVSGFSEDSPIREQRDALPCLLGAELGIVVTFETGGGGVGRGVLGFVRRCVGRQSQPHAQAAQEDEHSQDTRHNLKIPRFPV